jgi:polyribonucleotide nucleotidyltransferase
LNNFFNKITTKTFKFGSKMVTLETGKMARQATASVKATIGNTVVLSTVVVNTGNSDLDYFPLTVHYTEKAYANGKIPGGFLRRESRPSDNETLIARLIDRPIRPLFDSSFCREIQIVNTVISMEEGEKSDVAALLATSAALSISGLPFNGPVGAARIGYNDSGYVLNPSIKELENSKLDMFVSGTQSAVLMVESEAKELSEELMLGAVLFAHQEMQEPISAIMEFANEVNAPTIEWKKVSETSPIDAVSNDLEKDYSDLIESAYKIKEKQERSKTLEDISSQMHDKYISEEESIDSSLLQGWMKKIEKRIVRTAILNNQPRIDGRDLDTVRPIYIETGVLPSAHGSALFTRGETQALVVSTLSHPNNAQIVESIDSDTIKDKFMLHYNFPPYCVGETGRMGAPKRREIGHGNLAKKAIRPVLPSNDDMEYALRIVSEIMESNGSSSMASVCGSSLSLMDAGFPISAAVSGIAMGLVKEGDKFAVLTDILGDEDHLGDMDFKVAGTSKGITALQMDIKIEGIDEKIMEVALEKACTARMHILGLMNSVIDAPRVDVSSCVPKIHKLQISPNKIKDVIGKGGAVIQDIVKQTGADINISDDGVVSIFSSSKEGTDKAIEIIENLTKEAEIGKIYSGVVKKIVEFGAFVNILPGKDGLLHISQISENRVEKVEDELKEGQELKVLVLDVDRAGKIKLQYKGVNQG